MIEWWLGQNCRVAAVGQHAPFCFWGWGHKHLTIRLTSNGYPKSNVSVHESKNSSSSRAFHDYAHACDSILLVVWKCPAWLGQFIAERAEWWRGAAKNAAKMLQPFTCIENMCRVAIIWQDLFEHFVFTEKCLFFKFTCRSPYGCQANCQCTSWSSSNRAQGITL